MMQQRWEYKMVKLKNINPKNPLRQWNYEGEDGWGLVQVLTDDGVTGVFKRRIS
jgi:hypothetical protein